MQLMQVLTPTLEEDIAITQVFNPFERHDDWLLRLIVKAHHQMRKLLTQRIDEEMDDLTRKFVSSTDLCCALGRRCVREYRAGWYTLVPVEWVA